MCRSFGEPGAFALRDLALLVGVDLVHRNALHVRPRLSMILCHGHHYMLLEYIHRRIQPRSSPSPSILLRLVLGGCAQSCCYHSQPRCRLDSHRKSSAGVKTTANSHLDSGLRTRLREVLDNDEYRAFTEKYKAIWKAATFLQQSCISALIAELRTCSEEHEESASQLEVLNRLDAWQQANEQAIVCSTLPVAVIVHLRRYGTSLSMDTGVFFESFTSQWLTLTTKASQRHYERQRGPLDASL
jgi:hypothetical protein